MARVYKKPLYRPIPEGANIITLTNGTKHVVWMVGGQEKTAKYVETKNGPRIVEESQVYVARYTDGTGRFRERSTGCRDLRAAEHQLNAWLQEADKIKAGIISQEELEESLRQKGLIVDCFPSFIRHLKSKSATEKHISYTTKRFNKVCSECGFIKLTDFKTEVLLRWLQTQAESGMGASTSNAYRKAVVTFCNWAESKKYLRYNPFKTIPVQREDLDVRRERRALTGEEIGKLLKAAQERPLFRKKRADDYIKQKAIRKGLERKLIYATLLYTGLRKNELASITFGQVFLDDKIPHIFLKAPNAKSRKAAKLPLHPELIVQLKEWVTLREKEGTVSPQDNLFRITSSLNQILTADLAFAGIEKRDALDRTIDVHSLRHTHATILVEQGVPITVVQKAMRHADIRQTLRYTHTELENVSDGIGKLPDFLKKDDDQAGAAVPC